jgi:hypothetical protein
MTIRRLFSAAARPDLAPRLLGPAVLALALGLAACGAKPDAASASRKADDSPNAGADAADTAPGWKAGDAAGWEEHMRTRAQNQNEYLKTVGR